MVDQPLFSQRPVSADPQAYGQRLFAALGGERFRSMLEHLPRAPHPDSLIAIQIADMELAAIPWEYLHDDADFLIFNFLVMHEVPGAPSLSRLRLTSPGGWWSWVATRWCRRSATRKRGCSPAMNRCGG